MSAAQKALGCPHCDELRAAHREVLDEFGLDALPRWGERRDVDAGLRKSQLLALSVDDGVCDCDCHTPARIAGRKVA